MVDERTVLVTLGVTLALGVLAIAYLREPLRRVLFDICRKRDHARFWAASADVLLLAVPLAFELLLIDLGSAADSQLMWTLQQLKWALLGLVAAVVVVSVGVLMLGRSATVPGVRRPARRGRPEPAAVEGARGPVAGAGRAAGRDAGRVVPTRLTAQPGPENMGAGGSNARFQE